MSETENDGKILNALKAGSKNIELLISETGIAAAPLLSTLTMLELRRRVRRLPGMIFELADGAGPALVVLATDENDGRWP
jgi:predicted Rossmann fold nucleotide-binding protein DprA/Smf involved in DNA uptake